jgi:GTP cyclohydrolase FolE2
VRQVALKKPDARMLARLNPITPFEDATSLEFLSERNDASLLLIGSNSKKRPNNLVFVRRLLFTLCPCAKRSKRTRATLQCH